jgi:hypothetical protein
VEDRVSGLEGKIDIKAKTEELLNKRLKSCERIAQELTDSIKRPNSGIMGIEEGEEGQAKGIQNIFNKITAKNFPNLQKDLSKMQPLYDILPLKQLAQIKNIKGFKTEKKPNEI